MALRIPPAHQGVLAALLQLSKRQLDRLVEAVREAAPSLFFREIVDRVERSVGIERGVAESVANLLGSLYNLRIDQGFSIP